MQATGKIAVITGAGSGIGRASALALYADGFSIVLAGRRRNMLVVGWGTDSLHI
jgi:NADP-dependent 3-hydroxy acid dehydrogenase YdfG